MNIPRQRESADEIYRCLAERDCPELAVFRITREDRLGKRTTLRFSHRRVDVPGRQVA